MYSAGRTFRDRARQSLEAGCDAAHPARRMLKRCDVGRPGAGRVIEFVLQVLKFRLAPIQLGEQHREFVHWRRPFGCMGYGHDKDSPAALRQASAWRGLGGSPPALGEWLQQNPLEFVVIVRRTDGACIPAWRRGAT
jgi:hypothetical protein